MSFHQKSVWKKWQVWINQIYKNYGNKENLNITKDKNLNERDYGDLTGLNKKETADKFGEEQVHKWRRGYSDQPPNGESLEDVVRRVKIYFEESINPAIQSADNNNILIAAHGNSLRALLIVMNIYDSSNINSVELSTGVPIHVILENNKFLIKN